MKKININMVLRYLTMLCGIGIIILETENYNILIGFGFFLLGYNLDLANQLKEIRQDMDLFYRILKNSKTMNQDKSKVVNNLRELGEKFEATGKRLSKERK